MRAGFSSIGTEMSLPSFNDDVQGTGAVNMAAVLAAVNATGIDLPSHRIVIFGAVDRPAPASPIS